MLASNSSSQTETEMLDNRVQVLKSLPVNLSVNTEPQEAKREPFSAPTETADAGSPPLAMVKAEAFTSVFMPGAGLHYRGEGEEPTRVVYEQSPYEATTVSHTTYLKEDQKSPPDSPYEEDTDGVRMTRMEEINSFISCQKFNPTAFFLCFIIYPVPHQLKEVAINNFLFLCFF